MKHHTAVLPFTRSQHGTIPAPRGLLSVLLATLCLSLVQPFAALAQTSTTPLPPAAQEALDKGIIAAKVPDYLLAIRYFEEARKLAPQAPVVFLNRGLAESRIPGRELRAMAWFGAYLSAYPDAPNAAAVKEQIAVLDVRNQSNVSRLLRATEDAANQILGTSVDDLWSGRGNKNASLTEVAILQAQLGDITAALRIAELIERGGKYDTQSDIAVAQAKSGDFAGAQKTFDVALKTADFLKESSEKSWAKSRIAQKQIEAGDTVGARNTLVSAIKNANQVINASDVDMIRSAIAQTQAKISDIEGAQKTANVIQDADNKRWAQDAIIEAQAKIGFKNTSNQNLDLTPTAKGDNQSFVVVSDWLKQLDEDLSVGLFLDLASHLKSLPTSDSPPRVFKSLSDAANKIVTAQNVVRQMMKRQTWK